MCARAFRMVLLDKNFCNGCPCVYVFAFRMPWVQMCACAFIMPWVPICVFRIVLLDKSFRLTNTFIPLWCSLWCQVRVPLVRWCQLQEAHGLASSTVHCSADGMGWITDQRWEPFPCSDRSVSSIAYHRLRCQSQDHISTLHCFSSRMFGKEKNPFFCGICSIPRA